MKFSFLCAAILFYGTSTFAAAPLIGDYVEARTASVFAGACHYNGELVTTGRDAVMAWNVTSGQWNGINLAGVKAVAAVTSDANLGDEHAARKSELIIDTAASNAQAAAFTQAVRATGTAALGEIVSVHRVAIHFTHDATGYTVDAPKIISLSVQPMPNGECCKQPNLVWYKPLLPLTGRKVGYTTNTAYAAGTLGDTWQRANENSAFYGSFSFNLTPRQ